MSKIALVTGGTRGIGEAISKKLKKQGHTVVVNFGSVALNGSHQDKFQSGHHHILSP